MLLREVRAQVTHVGASACKSEVTSQNGQPGAGNCKSELGSARNLTLLQRHTPKLTP